MTVKKIKEKQPRKPIPQHKDKKIKRAFQHFHCEYFTILSCKGIQDMYGPIGAYKFVYLGVGKIKP